MTHAAITGSFADYRLIKSRSVLQIVVECPVEAQAQIFAALGYPMPGEEIPVAVARINPQSAVSRERPAEEETPAMHTGNGASHRGRIAYRNASPAERAVTRAAMLPKDERFRAWVADQNGLDIAVGEESAAGYIREQCCGGGSRGLIGEDPEAYNRFIRLENEYLVAVGLLAEPR